MQRKICIIGGGASGLMAAIQAARCGAGVTLLEQNRQVGKKILATGNGRCNLTNLGDIKTCRPYRGSDISFADKIISQWTVFDTTAFFEELGVMLADRDGWVYPYNGEARTILEAMLQECQKIGVTIKTNETVTGIEKSAPENKSAQASFKINTKNWHYQADAVILACGSPASSVSGSSEEGINMAKRLGHHIIPLYPALTSLYSEDGRIKGWGGCRCYGTVSLKTDHQSLIRRSGQLQLINGGISGIPVFQISRYASRALGEKKTVEVILDFMPDKEEEELLEWFRKHIKDESTELIPVIRGLLPENLCRVILRELQNETDKPLSCPKQTAEDQLMSKLRKAVRSIKHFSLPITGCGNLKHAQVCSGGVKTDEINPTSCESALVKNLYITGEMLDIDGDCGGWNLQFAWATGALAGRAAAKSR